MLRLSIDDELEDDDIQGEADALPFVISRLLFDQYGTEFSIALEPDGKYLVTPQEWKIAPFRDTRFSISS
jgi:hypothetical protein